MALHNLEKRILLALQRKAEQTAEELMKAAEMDSASVNHASAWLMSKGLVDIEETPRQKVELGAEGKEYLKQGLPERRLLKLLEAKPLSVAEATEKIGAERTKIATAWLSRQGLIKIDGGNIIVTDQAKKYIRDKLEQEKALESIGRGEEIEEELLKKLAKRGNIIIIRRSKQRNVKLTDKGLDELRKGIKVEDEISQLTPELIATGEWKKVKLREYDTTMPVKKVYIGRRHFMNQGMEFVRRVWLEMGFKEMQGPMINTEFWNFDALFVPQEHPAREMQDTFFVEPSKGELPDAKIMERVRKAHEIGVCNSTGWEYKWDPEIARRNVLRPHTTVLSAKILSALKKDQLPAKYFAIGRCFRNETLDWKHLFEFNQFEGIVVDEDANFRNLIGYLREFFNKIGFEKARFRPGYFPYTEPSLEIDVYHPDREQWMELGGAGIFRPELTEPLLGEPIPVLAWGPGFDRSIMDYYGIKDMRELYKNDIKQLREVQQWMM